MNRIHLAIFAGNTFSNVGTDKSASSEDGKDIRSDVGRPTLVSVRQRSWRQRR